MRRLFGLKGLLHFCEIAATDLNYHSRQQLSLVWASNLGGDQRIKFSVDTLGKKGDLGLDTRTPGTKTTNMGSLWCLNFEDKLGAEVVLTSP